MKKIRTGLLMTALASALLFPSPLTVFGADGGLPAAAIPAKGTADYSQVLPANVAAVAVINNFFQFVNADLQTPATRLFNHPAVQMLLKDSAEEMKKLPSQKELEETFGLTAKDLPRLFSGKAAIAAIIVDKEPGKEPEVKIAADGEPGAVKVEAKVEAKVSKDVEFIGLIEFTGSAMEFDRLVGKLRDEIKKTQPGSSLIQEQTNGVTLYTVETVNAEPDEEDDAAAKNAKPETVFFTLSNGTLVIADKKDLLFDTVKALDRGVAAKPLSGDTEFIAVKQEIGTNDGYFMINLNSITSSLREQMLAGLANSVVKNPAAKQFIDPQTFLNALGLENFSALYGSVRIDGGKVDVRSGLTWKERVGLATLINFGKQPVGIPAFVGAEYKGMSASTVDIPATWDAFRGLVQKASPAAWPMLTMVVASQADVSKKLEMFRKGLMDNVEPGYLQLTGYATATPAASEQPGKAVLIKLKDPVLAQETIDTLLKPKPQPDGTAAETLKVKEYLGVKIYQTPELPIPVNAEVKKGKDKADKEENEAGAAAEEMKPQMMRLSYAFLDSYLIVTAGSDGMIEGVIANMKNPGKPLATDQFLDTIGTLPGTECGIGYADLATGVRTVLNETIRNNKTGVPEEELVKARDACKDLHFFYASKSYFNDKGLYMRMIIAEDEKFKAAGK